MFAHNTKGPAIRLFGDKRFHPAPPQSARHQGGRPRQTIRAVHKTASVTERLVTTLWQNLLEVWSPARPATAWTALQSIPASIPIDETIPRVECALSIRARMPNVRCAKATPTLSQWEGLWEDRADLGDVLRRPPAAAGYDGYPTCAAYTSVRP